MDRVLVGADWPAMSPWWRKQVERFIRSGRRRWVLRVGRRGGKSSTLCRVAVAWALWGSWSVPPGDTAVIPFVSVDRSEAAARLHTIREILGALGVAFEPKGDEILLPERRLVFRVVTCSVSGTVGFTSVACFADEMARWESRDEKANPAKEVMASLRPTMATQARAFEVCSSSPWGTEDYHHELFEAGESEHQVTAHAATWEANPTLTEERTHELEPDARAWSREYAAIPGGTVTESWFGSAVDKAIETEQPPPIPLGVRPLFAIDPAFDGDSSPDLFGFAALTSEAANENGRHRRVTRVRRAGAWKPDRSPFDLARRVRLEVCNEIDPSQNERELVHVYSDQHEGASFSELARAAGLSIEVIPWTGAANDTGRTARFRSVRTAMLQGDFKIPDDAELIRQFRAVRGILSPSGVERIELPRDARGHCDALAAVVLGGSIALSRTADRPATAKPALTEQQKWREAEIRKMQQRRVSEFKRIGLAGLARKAMGL